MPLIPLCWSEGLIQSFSKSSGDVVNNPRQRFIHPECCATGRCPSSGSQELLAVLKRMRGGRQSQPPLGRMSIWFFEADSFNSEDGSFQSRNHYSQFVSWQLLRTFLCLFFSPLNNNITLYFWSRDVIVVPVCSPISFTTLLTLLCKHISCFSDIFYFSLKEIAQTLYFYPYAASLLQAASPFCVVITLVD